MSATRRQQGGPRRGPREGSVMWAVIRVLDGKRKPMSPSGILAEIQKRGLATGLKGQTPEATVAARLSVHAAKGLYVERPEKGKYRLKKGVTANSIAGDAGGGQTSTARSKTTGRRRKRAQDEPAQHAAEAREEDEQQTAPA